MTTPHDDFIEWCIRERDEALKSIEFWSQPNAMIQQGEIGKALVDVTPQHIADLKRIVENMNKIIDAEKAHAASS